MTLLAAALADLYLQVPEWTNLITEMLERYYYNFIHIFNFLIRINQGGTDIINIYLILFKIFPEEIYNRHLRIGENRRLVVEKELALQTESVIQFLVKIKLVFYF